MHRYYFACTVDGTQGFDVPPAPADIGTAKIELDPAAYPTDLRIVFYISAQDAELTEQQAVNVGMDPAPFTASKYAALDAWKQAIELDGGFDYLGRVDFEAVPVEVTPDG